MSVSLNRKIGIPDVPMTCFLTKPIPDPRRNKNPWDLENLNEDGVEDTEYENPMSKWACNQELYSNYLMKKTELAAQYKTYLMDHPALRALMSDFMQKLLFKKPDNVFEFAYQFFIPLLKISEEDSESSGCETDSSDEGNRSSDEEELFGKSEQGDGDEEIMKNVIQLHQVLFPTEEGGEIDDECDDPCLLNESKMFDY